MIERLKEELEANKDLEKASVLQGFFKTGKGEYGEGDIFLGVNVPKQREIAKKYTNIPLLKLKDLLESKIHEHRMCAGLILVEKYKKSSKEEIVNFYLKNAKKFNNWDLVDLTAPKILGDFLVKKNRKILYDLSKSKNIWERRISIVSTYALIKNNEIEDTLEISKILLEDKEELINKAVGWMLREVGKTSEKVLESFLRENYKEMKRVTLRYAIEKFSKEKQKEYLSLI